MIKKLIAVKDFFKDFRSYQIGFFGISGINVREIFLKWRHPSTVKGIDRPSDRSCVMAFSLSVEIGFIMSELEYGMVRSYFISNVQ